MLFFSFFYIYISLKKAGFFAKIYQSRGQTINFPEIESIDFIREHIDDVDKILFVNNTTREQYSISKLLYQHHRCKNNTIEITSLTKTYKLDLK